MFWRKPFNPFRRSGDNQDIGKVVKQITSEEGGRVKFEYTEWPAQLFQSHSGQPHYQAGVDSQMLAQGHQPIVCPGAKVRVVGRDGLTLLVMPLP